MSKSRGEQEKHEAEEDNRLATVHTNIGSATSKCKSRAGLGPGTIHALCAWGSSEHVWERLCMHASARGMGYDEGYDEYGMTSEGCTWCWQVDGTAGLTRAEAWHKAQIVAEDDKRLVCV